MALTKRAKLPVGKMVRVKRDEVVTGYQANRDGTTSLLIEKKRRAPNPRKRKYYETDYTTGISRWVDRPFSDKELERQKKAKARRAAKKKGNPSVRKSKKYFKRAAKRLGVKLPKRVPRKVTHSKANPDRPVIAYHAHQKYKADRAVEKLEKAGISSRLTFSDHHDPDKHYGEPLPLYNLHVADEDKRKARKLLGLTR